MCVSGSHQHTLLDLIRPPRTFYRERIDYYHLSKHGSDESNPYLPPLNGSDRDDITPLVLAVLKGDLDVVDTLLNAKADPEGGRVPQPVPEEQQGEVRI